MKLSLKWAVSTSAVLVFGMGSVRAADVDGMLSACRSRAASALHVVAGDVSVKYEGQRTDKTHAVNGSATAHGQERTFQCSFTPSGKKIAKFILNPAPKAAPSQAGIEPKEAEASQRAGAGKFDATGKIPCAQKKGQPMGPCEFGVARAGGGSATVVVTRPDGRKRTIFFTKGKALSADTSQADGYPPFRATKKGDLYSISVGEERYEIPEAVVFGG